MGYMLAGLKFFGISLGIAFLYYALSSLNFASFLEGVGLEWPATMVEMANYFGVTTALQLFLSFLSLKISIKIAFAIGRMF